jgi:hypothetical protein
LLIRISPIASSNGFCVARGGVLGVRAPQLWCAHRLSEVIDAPKSNDRAPRISRANEIRTSAAVRQESSNGNARDTSELATTAMSAGLSLSPSLTRRLIGPRVFVAFALGPK